MFETFISFVILMYCSVKCEEMEFWCPYVSQNGSYEGLRIYHPIEWPTEEHTFVMFNTFGNEWQFSIEFKTTTGRPFLQFQHNSIKNIPNTNVINKYTSFVFEGNRLQYCDCQLLSKPDKTVIIKCWDEKHNYHQSIDSTYANRVILKPKPSDSSANYVKMFSKEDKYTYIMNICKRVHHFCGENDIKPECKPEPKFVYDMNPTLFKSIESVVYFYLKGSPPKSGYLLLFNINGRPMICFTSEGEHISEECKSSEKMSSIFGKCFNTSETTTPVNTTAEVPNDSKTWLIIVIIVGIVIVIAIIIAIFCCIKRKRKTGKYSLSQSSKITKGKGSVSEQLAKMDGKFEIMKFKSET